MRFDSKRHHRRSIRLKGYDYSSTGIYFITICTENRDCLLGEIENGRMKLSDIGEIVNTEWLQSFEIRKEIKLDTYVIMPNHIHAIVCLYSTVGANGGLPPNNNYQISKNGLPPTNNYQISKSGLPSTNKFQIPKYENNKNPINKRANCHSPLHMKPRSLSSFVAGFKSTVSGKIGFSVWQRNYYDHIIRNDEDLDNIRKYIKDNPIKWSEDEDNPINKK